MKRSYCKHCGRETADSVRDRGASPAAEKFCARVSGDGPLHGWWHECEGFAAGRRAAFKEAQRIVDTFVSRASGTGDDIRTAFRAALKAPRRKA